MTSKDKYFLSGAVGHHLKQGAAKTEGFVAYLHTFTCGQEVHMVGCSSVNLMVCDNNDDVLTVLEDCLPGGVEIGGLLLITNQPHNSDSVLEACNKFMATNSGDVIVTSDMLVLASVSAELDDASLYSYSLEEKRASLLDMLRSDILDNILDGSILVRVSSSLPFSTKYNKDTFSETLSTQIEELKTKVMSPTTAFLLNDTQFILSNRSKQMQMKCQDMLKHLTGEEDKSRKTLKHNSVANFQILMQRTGEEAVMDNMNCAPVIRHKHTSFQQLDITLPIDVVGYIHPTDVCSNLYDLMVRGICSQLSALSRCLSKSISIDQQLHTPEPFHFKPQGMGHLLTVCYPMNVEEDMLEGDRHLLHKMFFLPDDRPQVKRLNVYKFPSESIPGGYLVNPHNGARRPGCGTLSLVQGLYTYHHYMQDKMDDNGWGCAYRSLQTIVSWFRLQGHTDKPIPTHKEIQQALLDVGDKNASFVGSKKWIGSTEVSYVLDHLLQVTSKIMCVSSGGDLAGKGRELAQHFNTQGTPIMVGGGVLAHTILGVDYNESSGDLYFLILDPHYTGAENLKVVQDKGWCSWKDSNFWDKNVYYNLCMPQRPKEI